MFVFASKQRDGSTGRAALDLLRNGHEPIPLTSESEPLSVTHSRKSPARALFADSLAENGIGTLMLVELEASDIGTKHIVPEGEKVSAEAAWFGTKGDEILFVGNYSSETFRGSLFWSNGATSRQIASNATPIAVAISTSRRFALAGADLAADGIGNLLRIDLSNGESTVLVENVRLLNSLRRGHFWLSGDERSVFAVRDSGALLRVSAEGGPAETLAAHGGITGSSTDGKTVAFIADGKVMALRNGDLAELGPVTSNTHQPPTVSPNGEWVFWCDSVEFSPGPLGANGYLARTDGTGSARKIATNVACDRVELFDETVAIIANLERFGRGRYDGFGRHFFGPVDDDFEEITAGVLVDGVRRMDYRLLVAGNQSQGSSVATLFALPSTVGAQPIQLRGNVLTRSVSVSEELGRATFLADPAGTLDGAAIASLYVTTERNGTLTAEQPQGAHELGPFIAHAMGADGRVYAVRAADGTVWSMAVP